jgi:2-oxo-4-hydroxy-4-carboxy--5-ureidoimidazoline (OHCU) decarboxylase
VLPAVGDLNRLELEVFARALQPLFEAARPLAEALYAQRPFTSYRELIDRAESTASSLPDVQQIQIVNAHPRIGANPTQISALSFKEQGYDRPTSDDDRAVLTALAELNEIYEARFGFRFVVFVNKRPRSEILSVLRERLKNSRDDELRTALRDMFLIARDRLRGLRTKTERTED